QHFRGGYRNDFYLRYHLVAGGISCGVRSKKVGIAGLFAFWPLGLRDWVCEGEGACVIKRLREQAPA
ncbi:hypothetical protein, partial [Mixta calida]|uniref:hypothetical protein n=1 Tax=Mixta calida TaxID=665913 RepID=UPI002896F8D0